MHGQHTFLTRKTSYKTILVLAVSHLASNVLAVHGEIHTSHWSFQKPTRPPVPKIDAPKIADRELSQHARNPIDAFVLHRLQLKNFKPAPQANRHTLVRRAYYDLLGLPPSPEQLEQFTTDTSANAWPKLIDQLLDSPHYGERWGRHWLDVARYADSGGFETDIYHRNAWRYRDYVIQSFNDDKPYDRFVQEQIAGDELWPGNLDLDPKRVYVPSEQQKQDQQARCGTGFYSLGPLVHESGLDANRLRSESLTDWADSTGSVFMGLTLGCARCHEHKFDPISQDDYYALQAVFAGAVQAEEPLITPMEIHDWRQHYPRLIGLDEKRKAYQLFKKQTEGRELTEEEKQQEQKLVEEIGYAVINLPERTAGIPNSAYDGIMEIPTMSVLAPERQSQLKPVHFLERGELYQPQHKVSAALPDVLSTATNREPALPGPYGSRKEFALWLTQPDHPLTARVMVNRIWQGHFGQAIVTTPNDFGDHGARPSHPELLDWLATEFVTQGWSIKKMHRLIMLSSTYQMASNYSAEQPLAQDPNNRFLWRMNRRRLEAEALWDAVHATAGTINLKMGGRPVIPPLAEDEIAALRDKWHWPVAADPAEHTRRGVYIIVRRNFRFPMFEVFDAPVNSVSCPQRDVTTVAPQALWTLNSPSVYRQAQQLADRVVKESSQDPVEQIARLWKIALARPISEQESQEALQLLAAMNTTESADSENQSSQRAAALSKLCLAIFNLNEFAYID